MPQQAPAVGHIEDGYRFMGGDPSNQNSWRQLSAESNWESNTAPQDTGHPVADFVHNAGGRAAQSFVQPFLHPIDTVVGAARQVFDPLYGAQQGQADAHDPHAIANLTGDLAAGALQGGVFGAGSAAVRGGIPSAMRWAHPTPSPEIVPPAEMASRRLAQAVIPPTKDAASFIKAAPLEVPNIMKFAQESGNPLRTQLEFGKAAEGSAKQARDFYENEVLGPNDKTVKTTGSGFGQRQGEGPDTYARLSDIDKRVVQLNKQLDAPTLNADDARRALASKEDLQHEHDALTSILHRSLADVTGMAPEDVANLRQRVGRSYELANDTNAAVTGRMQGEGRASQQTLHWSQLPFRAFEKLSGGPQAIADRQFVRAIKNFPGESQPLPTIRPFTPAAEPTLRPPVWANAGIEAGQPEMQPLTPDTKGARAQWENTRAERASKNDQARIAKQGLTARRVVAGALRTKSPNQ